MRCADDNYGQTTDQELKDQVVSIRRVTKVVKGGKNLSFSALVVVGDQAGRVGFGMGKAKEVPSAIRKGLEKAKKSMIAVPLIGSTIPHAVLGRFGAGQVLLKPAAEGTGVIAGGPVRAVMESAGIRNVVTKSLGSANPHNMVKATFEGLVQLRNAEEVSKRAENRSNSSRRARGSHGKERRGDGQDQIRTQCSRTSGNAAQESSKVSDSES